MVWGMEKGRTCFPIVAVQIQDPQLALEQMLMFPLGSTAVQYHACPCGPQHPLFVQDTPLDLKASTHSPLSPPIPVSMHTMGTQ